MTESLAGDSIRLRAKTAADVGVLYEVDANLATWEERNPRPPRPVSREEYEERYRAALAKDDGDVEFVIDAGGSAVGHCHLFRFDPLARTAEVGIALHPSAVGKGYGTDSLRVLVRFAFERRNLRRVHLTVIASNAAAIASYRKVGFVEEGRRRESAWVRGGYQDEIVMGLLRSEWQQG
jgi:RimJ/RimL family protein N-acetyltransferase